MYLEDAATEFQVQDWNLIGRALPGMPTCVCSAVIGNTTHLSVQNGSGLTNPIGAGI
jgi:hypothetical protein